MEKYFEINEIFQSSQFWQIVFQNASQIVLLIKNSQDLQNLGSYWKKKMVFR